MRPIICMVTAPQRSSAQGDRALVDRIRAAAFAGVHLVQIRQPDFEARSLAYVVENAVRAVEGTRTRVLVNDRIDVALAVGAHGVHLRGDSVTAPRVRSVAPAAFLIGRSVHSPAEADGAACQRGLDYLIYGTVFSTASKPGVQATGPAALAEACAAVPLPILAIGGITHEQLGAVAGAGAAGFAAISLFAECGLDSLPSVVERAIRMFDGSGKVQ